MVRMKTIFNDIAAEVGALVTEKNAAYGDSFSRSNEVISILYPEGIKPEQYEDFLTVIRVIDKLFRIATRKGAFGESPWMDVMGYALLAVARERVNETFKSVSQK